MILKKQKELKKILISIFVFIIISLAISYCTNMKVNALEEEKNEVSQIEPQYKGDCEDESIDFSEDIVVKIIEKMDSSLDINFINKFDEVDENNKPYYSIELSVSGNLDKIKSIEYAGERNTYDLSVECDRNFLCGQGIVTHNTEDMCILILWHMFRQPNAVHNDPTFTYNTLILTPYETQIDLIFDRLNQLIDCSETLKSITPRRIHHRIEFSNNGAIIGLTLGVGTGKEGSNTRGQKASYLVYDEVDQII